jgi:NAD(P)H dehydrogenase (quinone)
MYAVFGATGNTGRATVKELQALGEDPLCVVRSLEKARDVLGPDSRTAVVEITDRSAIEQALRGIERVFVVTGHNPHADEQQINILEAAKAAGVDFFVKVSGGRDVVGPEVESIVGRGHYAVEEAMKNSGVPWCVLSPGLFMQNTFAQAASIKNDGRLAQAFDSDLPVALIDVRDTGAVGARVLRDPANHVGKTSAFTGATTTFREFARVFSEVLGRPITYVPLSVEQSEAGMKARNMPEWLIGHLVAIARAGAKGAFSKEQTGPIRDIVGRAPITTRQFVEDFSATFS